MAQAQGPLDRAVDLFVYAPIGLAVLARDFGALALADLAKRGRSEIDQTQRRVGNQVTQYRFIGQYAVDHEIAPRVAPLLDELKRVADRFAGGVPDATQARAEQSTPAPSTSAAPNVNGSRPLAPAPATSPTAASPSREDAADRAAQRAAAAALPIHEYDELSASQVVERLAGLTPSELNAISAYEGGRRRRKTILTRIEQLTR